MKCNLKKNDFFPFGKHKCESIESVARNDPEYIVWFNDNIAYYQIEESVVEAAETALNVMFRNHMHNKIRKMQRLYR